LFVLTSCNGRRRFLTFVAKYGKRCPFHLVIQVFEFVLNKKKFLLSFIVIFSIDVDYAKHFMVVDLILL
jgi:hypothetical protein